MHIVYWILVVIWALFSGWHEYDTVGASSSGWQRWLAHLALLLLLIVIGLRAFHELPAAATP